MTQRAFLQLRLLGRFPTIVIEDGGRCVQLRTRKAGALLAYLAMSRDFAAGREELAGLLWGEDAEQQSRQSLRQALAVIRREIGSTEALVADARMVRLEPTLWSIDARCFLGLASSSNREELAQAASLFAGDLLSDIHLDEEPFEEWLRGQRTRLQAAAGQLCRTFVEKPELVSDGEQAVALAEQLLALDPLREDWQRFAITLYARYRGRSEAVARANSFAELLQRELGVGPEKETRALLDSLKRDTPSPPPTPRAGADAAPPMIPDPAPLPLVPEHAPIQEGIQEQPILAQASRWQSIRKSPLAFAAVLTGAMLLPAAGALLAPYMRPHAAQPAVALRADPSRADPSRTDPWQPPDSFGEPRRMRDLISMVVLPFTSLGDSSAALSADMLTDDLTIRLSRIPSFRVISRQTARSYRDQRTDVAAIGAELQVGYVLEGSVRLQDGNMRVNVELIDPASRASVWSDRVEREEADRQGVLDEIVSRLARELQMDVLPIQSARLSQDVRADALAYRGWAALSKMNLQSYAQGLSLLEQALQRDPDNLSAQVGLGAYHARMAAQLLDADSDGHREAAERILRKVLARVPDSSQAHFFLGLTLNRLPTLQESLAHFEYAARIDPSDANAHAQIGSSLIRLGRPAQGLDHVRYAIRLSPRDPVLPIWLEFAGNGELELGHYAEATELFQRSATLSPGYPRAFAGLVAANALAGRMDEARQQMAKLRSLAPSFTNQDLIRHFGRSDIAKLHEGLTLTLAAETASTH